MDERITKLSGNLENVANNITVYEKEIEKLEEDINGIVSLLQDSSTPFEDINIKLNTIISSGITDLSTLEDKIKPVTTQEISEAINNGKLKKVTYEGVAYYIPNTRRDLFGYHQHILDEGLYESANNYALDDRCITLAKIYAFDLISYKKNPHTIATYSSYNPSDKINKQFASKDVEDVYKFIYEEALQGRPTTIRVTGGPEGHWVTFVGFAANVSNPKDFNPDNMLVLDNFNGELKPLSKCAGKGRVMQKSPNYYYACGATDAYLNDLAANKVPDDYNYLTGI